MKDFQSAVSEITDANSVYEYLQEALDNQHLFDKSFINPIERYDFNIKDFTIQPEKIDRLYYLSTSTDDIGRDFELIARIESIFYVYLCASCDNTGFNCQGMGKILLGFDPIFFMKSTLVNTAIDRVAIYKLLEKDSIFIEQDINNIIERNHQMMATFHDTLTLDELKHMSFPITQDRRSIEYVRKNKLMVIMKGLPGSGKSSVTRKLQEIYSDAVVCSADHYFITNGKYKFEADKLEEAHKVCQEKAKWAAQNNYHVVVIDNANIKRWESGSYLQIAKQYNYFVLYIEPQTPWRFDVKSLVQYNKHGVEENIIKQKLKSYQPLHPLYFAWFFNEADSREIIETSRNWFKLALSIPACLEYFKQVTHQNTKDAIIDYYMSNNTNSILHVTAKYIGPKNKKNTQSLDYINNPRVKESMGKIFTINNVGYVITPYTYGARVKLTDEQLELWGADDYECRPETEQKISKEGGRGSRAHITLGYAPRVKPLITGFDVRDVYIEEKENCNNKTFNISNTVVKCYDNGSWVIYPKKTVYEAMFLAYY